MPDLEMIKQLESQIGFPLKQLPFDKIYDPTKQQFVKEKWRPYGLRAYAINAHGQVIALSLDFISTYFYDDKLLSKFSQLTLLSVRGVTDFDVPFLASLRNIRHLDLSGCNLSEVAFLKELKSLNSLDFRVLFSQ